MSIFPAIHAGIEAGGELIDSATLQNIKQNVEALKQAAPILKKRIDDGKLKVVGGLYHLDTGIVEIVA